MLTVLKKLTLTRLIALGFLITALGDHLGWDPDLLAYANILLSLAALLLG